MKAVALFAVLFSFGVGSISIARADEYSLCDKVGDNDHAWSCPLPEEKLPVKCHIYGDVQICTGPLDEKTKAVNCGFRNVRGKLNKKYMCW